MIFETPPKDFKPFAFVLKEFPNYPHNKIFYVKLKRKSIINKVEVFWFDEKINKQYSEYNLSDVEENLKSGIWRKIEMNIHI